jgi:L-amino acid N-acyltransferase YncA
MISVQEETLTLSLANELMPLLELHRQEISAYKDMKLNVNVEKYIQMNNIGMYKIFVARSEGKLVGYLAYFIAPNMHYSDYVYATQDVIYVDKSSRGAMVGLKLLNEAEKELIKLGVNVATQHVKVKHDISPLMEKAGYDWVEKIFMKRLQ